MNIGKVRHGILSIAACVALACLTPQKADAGKLAIDLQSNGNGTVDVMVQFNTPLSSAHMAKLTQLGGRLKVRFTSNRYVTFTIPKSLVKYVSMLPDVKFMSPDRPMRTDRPEKNTARPAVSTARSIAAGTSWPFRRNSSR